MLIERETVISFIDKEYKMPGLVFIATLEALFP